MDKCKNIFETVSKKYVDALAQILRLRIKFLMVFTGKHAFHDTLPG